MSKPTTSYLWDTNKTRTVPSTSGHKTDGFVLDEVPASNELNYLLGAYSDWLDYLAGSVTKAGLPTLYVPGDWTPGPYSYVSSGGATTAGYARLDIPDGYALSNITFNAKSASTTSQFSVTVETVDLNGSPGAFGKGVIVSEAVTATTSFADYSFDLSTAATTGLNVSVDGSGHYTRSAGSFVTDGFKVGQWAYWAGFVNSANNGVHLISSVAPTILGMGGSTTSETASPVSVTSVSPIIGPDNIVTGPHNSMLLTLAPNASHVITIASIRYTCVRV